jgi:quercetin dioxygenase-like cupin family protein
MAAAAAAIVLDNDRVQVRRLEIAPGQSTGQRTGGADELTVFVKGGVLTSAATGRAVLWRDGRVAWSGAHDPPDAGSVNTGDAPIVIVVVTLKRRATPGTGPAAIPPPQRPISYPNVAGEDLLENDRLIVQRFSLQPGQWEGPHGHQPNSLWVFIRGGTGAARSHLEPAHEYPRPFADGEVGWMDPIDPSVGHESGNTDDHPSDWLWILLKD